MTLGKAKLRCQLQFVARVTLTRWSGRLQALEESKFGDKFRTQLEDDSLRYKDTIRSSFQYDYLNRGFSTFLSLAEGTQKNLQKVCSAHAGKVGKGVFRLCSCLGRCRHQRNVGEHPSPRLIGRPKRDMGQGFGVVRERESGALFFRLGMIVAIVTRSRISAPSSGWTRTRAQSASALLSTMATMASSPMPRSR